MAFRPARYMILFSVGMVIKLRLNRWTLRHGKCIQQLTSSKAQMNRSLAEVDAVVGLQAALSLMIRGLQTRGLSHSRIASSIATTWYTNGGDVSYPSGAQRRTLEPRLHRLGMKQRLLRKADPVWKARLESRRRGPMLVLLPAFSTTASMVTALLFRDSMKTDEASFESVNSVKDAEGRGVAGWSRSRLAGSWA